MREVTAELLAQEQRQIVACADAETALREFAGNSFDIVITDVSLPVMSGIDLARNLLRIKPHLPIIIASGYALDFGLENWAAQCSRHHQAVRGLRNRDGYQRSARGLATGLQPARGSWT